VGLAWIASGTPVQGQTTSAAVFGTVQDSHGGTLPGAGVALTSLTQGQTLTTTTDVQGRFVFPIVRPGACFLRVSKPGFGTISGVRPPPHDPSGHAAHVPGPLALA
jgi:hypothetical protein